MIRATKIGAAAILSFLVAFTGTAFALSAVSSGATTQVASTEPSWLDLARPVYAAFASGHYALTGALVVILVVALLKRYVDAAWMHSDWGGSLLALVASMATSLSLALALPDAHLTLSSLKIALFVGVTAAGGYAMIKNLLVTPLLKPLAAKAPAWMQPGFQLVFWVFDHQTAAKENVAANAVAAGNAAVAAAPAAGAAGVTGTPTEIK